MEPWIFETQRDTTELFLLHDMMRQVKIHEVLVTINGELAARTEEGLYGVWEMQERLEELDIITVAWYQEQQMEPF